MSTMLRKTPLAEAHLAVGAAMTEFGGWWMPVRYQGERTEHRAVREGVGVFDVSHMGEFVFSGPNALKLLQYLTCNDVSRLEPGTIHYNALMSESGGFLDDVLIYRLGSQQYLMVVNAGNREADWQWVNQHNQDFGATIEDRSDAYALLAVQGPCAVDVVQALTETNVAQLGYYHFAIGLVAGAESIISRTGYTGSDGFELYLPATAARSVWEKIFEVGKPYGIEPCGLSVRDSLRIEAGMPLHGVDISEHTTVLEAGSGWAVSWEKGDFVGKNILLSQKKEGVRKKWVGFVLDKRGVPRHGYPIFADGEKAGEVSSGTLSLSLNQPVGMAYLPVAKATPGTPIEVEIRGRRLPGHVVKKPFYHWKKKGFSG